MLNRSLVAAFLATSALALNLVPVTSVLEASNRDPCEQCRAEGASALDESDAALFR